MELWQCHFWVHQCLTLVQWIWVPLIACTSFSTHWWIMCFNATLGSSGLFWGWHFSLHKCIMILWSWLRFFIKLSRQCKWGRPHLGQATFNMWTIHLPNGSCVPVKYFRNNFLFKMNTFMIKSGWLIGCWLKKRFSCTVFLAYLDCMSMWKIKHCHTLYLLYIMAS